MSKLGKRLARLEPRTPPAETSLDDVRAALRRALGDAVARPQSSGARIEPLPFRRCATPYGSVERRRTRRSASVEIGSVPLEAALRCDSRMLSLLALSPELAGMRPERLLFLDTETSGLGSGTANVPFLVGVAWLESGASSTGDEAELVVEQLFLRDRDDEAALLESLRERVAACDAIVSFNGKSFDVPVLRARYVMNALAPLPDRPQLDLLHMARRVHRHRSFRKSLTILEREVLGFRRGPDVHGEEVAARYRHYLRSGDESGLHAVVTHNEHDVVSLAALCGLYGEPVDRLPASELASVARTIHRAGAVAEAGDVADLAVSRGAGAEGLRVRAELAKARGDKEQALADFEALSATVSDPGVRLELAKLYEHHRREPERALAQVAGGTGERDEDVERRRRRLERKRERLKAHG